MSMYVTPPASTFVYWSAQPFATSYSLVQQGEVVKIIAVPHRQTQALAKARGVSEKMCPDGVVARVMALPSEDKSALKLEILKIIRDEVARRLGLAGAHAVAAEVTQCFCEPCKNSYTTI